MNNLVFSTIPLEEMESMIKIAVKNAFESYAIPQPVDNKDSKFGDIDWLRSQHPKHPAKATVYANIYNGKIPKYLIYKPKGTKQVFFYKELVLQWINDGFPSESQLKA
jgi:hypothetical protein